LNFEYILSDTRSGNKTLILRDKNTGRDIKLHSAYDPVKEASRSVDSFTPGRSSIIIVSGLALGYHIELLRNKFPSLAVVAVEPDSKIISICAEHYPNAIKNLQIVKELSDIENIFSSLDMSSFKGIAHFSHRPSYQLNNIFYDKVIDEIKTFISSKVSDLLTRFEFEKKWISNIFKNFPLTVDAIGVSSFFGKFRDRPGIIVSAGPSLKKNIHLLNDLKRKCVIVAVDTALKVLTKHNISPHFVMTLDAQKYSQKHFNGITNGETVLLADIVCCHSVLKTFSNRKVISTTSKYYQNTEGESIRETTPTIDWFERFISSFGDIQSGGSVATSAFDFLLNAGCTEIVLVGQDLAYTGREIHCSGTYHNDDWISLTNRLTTLDSINQNIIRKRKTKHITSYGDKTPVISDFVFDLYKSWFEDSASKINIDVVNSTNGGSRIFNTIEKPLTDYLNKSIEVSTADIIQQIFNSSDKIANRKMKEIFDKTLNLFKELRDLLNSDVTIEEKFNRSNEIIDNNELSLLIDPLLRKINIYISRNEIDLEKSRELLIDEMRIITDFYYKLLKYPGLIES